MPEQLLKSVRPLAKPAMGMEDDSVFYAEMLAHASLFTHPHPQTLLMLGHDPILLEQLFNHSSLTQIVCISHQPFANTLETRLATHPPEWLKDRQQAMFDLIIHTQPVTASPPKDYPLYRHLLHTKGLLVLPCAASLLQVNELKSMSEQLKQAGFKHYQWLNFPQPSHATGWPVILLATPGNHLARIREKDIYNRRFATRYYNYDTHKAALALPEFARDVLDPVT